MRIGILGWIAITVVLVLLLIYISHSVYRSGYMPDGVFKDAYESMIISAHNNYDRYLETPNNLYMRTTGYENDESAQMALSKAMRLETAYNTNDLTVTANAAVNNAFILAEINRFNVAPNLDTTDPAYLEALDNTDLYYRRALNRIKNNTRSVIQYPEHGPAVEVILDRIVDYIPDVDLDIQHIRDTVRAERVLHATIKPAKSKTPQQTYFEPRVIRDDPQNVHDREINEAMRTKYRHILISNKHDADIVGSHNYKEPELDDIRTELRDSNISAEKKRLALNTLSKISISNGISSLNTTEDAIIKEVWKRIHSIDNMTNRDSMKNSLWDSLASGTEKNYSGKYNAVCSVGRCSRVIDSLTLMDTNTEIAKPFKTAEIIRNEILSKSYKILQDSLAKAQPAIANIYRGLVDETPETRIQLETFIEDVKNQIDTTTKLDYPDTKPDVLNNIIKDAQAGVDI